MPTLTGKGMMALILRANVCKIPPTAEWSGEGDDYGCTITLQRDSQPKPVRVSFTVGEAKKARLWDSKDVWKKFPDQMLQWRAVSRMADFYFADLTAGLGVMEVVRDHVELERAKPTEPDPLLVGAGAESPPPEVDPDTNEEIPDYIGPDGER